jgi:hypothetical protein
MRPITRLSFVVAVVVGLATGCSASASSTPTATPNASLAAEDICPEVDYQMPNGERLDLTGRWLANDLGSYYMTQDESCLFWFGESPPMGDNQAGADWANVFSGRIVSSFEVAGPWSDVPTSAGASANSGRLRLEIGFFEVDGVTWPALAMEIQEPVNEFGGTAWQPEITVSALETFSGTVGFEGSSCPWLEVAGQRYELVGYWSIEGQHIFSQSVRGVSKGAEARVEAQAAAALGDPGCEPSAQQLLVWDLYPAP